VADLTMWGQPTAVVRRIIGLGGRMTIEGAVWWHCKQLVAAGSW